MQCRRIVGLGQTTAAATVITTTTTFMVLMDWLPTPLNRNIDHSAPHDRLPSTVIHGEHTLIHLGLLASAVVSWIAFFTTPRRPR